MVEVADDLREDLLGLLVKIADRDTGCEDGVVGVGNGHVRSCLCGLEGVSECSEALLGETYQVVEFNRSHTLVNTRNDLLGNGRGIHMVGIKPITQS